MDIRDNHAAAALIGLLQNMTCFEREEKLASWTNLSNYADQAYRIADAMMSARLKGPGAPRP